MKTVELISDLIQARQGLDAPLGFVPTMGFLHPGHLALVKQAKMECASVVVSIFVNPAQFAPDEDLETYPRDIPKDLAMLEAEGVDLVWLPTPEIIYPQGFQTWVDVEEISQPLEGGMRPGHFRGVATIVTKLFNAVQPQKAYFGQKDAQQVTVIQQMTRDLNFPIDIVVVPTAREKDGLALSSRNVNLDPEQRQAAAVLFRALQAANTAYQDGERNGARLRKTMEETIQAEPLAEIEYVSCADRLTLQELHTLTQGALLSMAVMLGKTRLIDNWVLPE